MSSLFLSLSDSSVSSAKEILLIYIFKTVSVLLIILSIAVSTSIYVPTLDLVIKGSLKFISLPGPSPSGTLIYAVPVKQTKFLTFLESNKSLNDIFLHFLWHYLLWNRQSGADAVQVIQVR